MQWNRLFTGDEHVVHSMDYHHRLGRFYGILRDGRNLIVVAGTNSTKVPVPLARSVLAAIVVDWVSDKVYLSDSEDSKIIVMDVERGWNAILLGHDVLNQPYDLALDPTRGYLFVAERTRILRVDMDGSNGVELVSTVLLGDGVSCLTVDLPTQKIYWLGFRRHRIVEMDYDGGKQWTVIEGTNFINRYMHTVVLDRRFYWANQGKLHTVDKFSGEIFN